MAKPFMHKYFTIKGSQGQNNNCIFFILGYSWILGRQPTPFSAPLEAQIQQALARHKINPDLYSPTVQTGCVNY